MSIKDFKKFSKKQLLLLNWWCKGSQHTKKDAIICDGAVRSGKTVCMSLSFVFWAFSTFENQNFALCGKTITSLKRNVILPLITNLNELGFHCTQKSTQNSVIITYRNCSHRFYLFGGKDESSAALIQGITLAGVMFDEVALMPRSFVEQALARCSVPESKFWFNCNPEHPYHWFYQEWIQKSTQKKALYVHFTMQDNPSLSASIRKRYENLYEGTFYDRFILGKWTAQNGQVYPMFNINTHVIKSLPSAFSEYYISCDYGITNPSSFGLWGKNGSIWYRIKEYYYDSKKEQAHKTDEEYYAALKKLAKGIKIKSIIIDPSASSFIECIKRHREFKVIPASNDVNGGINKVAQALTQKLFFIHESCKDSIREFYLYSWDESKQKDQVKKEHDHAMDEIRYFINSVLYKQEDPFFVTALSRK